MRKKMEKKLREMRIQMWKIEKNTQKCVGKVNVHKKNKVKDVVDMFDGFFEENLFRTTHRLYKGEEKKNTIFKAYMQYQLEVNGTID